MDCMVHGFTKSWTQLSDFHFTVTFQGSPGSTNQPPRLAGFWSEPLLSRVIPSGKVKTRFLGINRNQSGSTNFCRVTRKYGVQPLTTFKHHWLEENETRLQNKAQTWISSLLTSVLTAFNSHSWVDPIGQVWFLQFAELNSLNLDYLKVSVCHLVKTELKNVLFHLFCRVWPLFSKGKNTNIYNLLQCFSNVNGHLNHWGNRVQRDAK